MLSKRKGPYDESSLQPEAKLQRNVRDLFGSNALPAHRIQSLVNDIADVSVLSFQGLRKPLGTNICRNLRRTFLKNCQWPKLYWAEVRVQCLRTSREVKQWCAFCLPHEYIHVLARLGDKEKVLDDSALDPLSKLHLEKCEALAGEKLLALGLWGDGVPCNWDRTESVETFTLNLPGNGEYKLLRLPLTAVSRKQVNLNTFHDMQEVFAWGLQCCAAGVFPHERHDGSAFLPESDRARSGQAGAGLGVRAALVEVRGDWKFLKECFHFPGWNTKAGCCWKCTCTPAQARLSVGSLGLCAWVPDSVWACLCSGSLRLCL